MNPALKFGRSDKRGCMILQVTPSDTTTLFLALDDVHNPASKIATLASFLVRDGQPGLAPA